MYILLCLLSSFFTYNSLLAKEEEHKYAFFIPNNAFQENTSVKELTPTKKTQKKLKRATQKTPQQTTETQTPNKLKKTLPIVIKELRPLVEVTSSELPKPQNKYQLDENINTKALVKKDKPQPTEDVEIAQEVSPLERYKIEDINDLLRETPHPNPKHPKFKQLYNLYALELRTLYKYKKLPTNLEQEKLLKKANTIRRFEVK